LCTGRHRPRGRSIRHEDVALSVFGFAGAATLLVTPTAGRDGTGRD
jgi:hypothetical protein